MRRLLLSILGLFVLAGPAASATLINFDDGIEKNAIGNFYSPLGVSFSGASWQTNFGLAGFSGRLALASTNSNPFKWDSSAPAIATFSTAATTASIVVLDLGENGFTLNAYDAAVGGNLVSSASLFGLGLGNNNFKTLSVSAASIFRLEMFQVFSASDDGVIVEDFRFAAAAAVPEPETYAMLLAGLGLLGFAARRRLQAGIHA